MKNKALCYVGAMVPLVAVNGFCLASGYFVKGNMQVNLTVAVLFLVISCLITVTKLFFDFFVALVALKCTGQELGSGEILDKLIRTMGVQWGVTAAALLLSRLMVPGFSAQTDLLVFAAAHTAYYILVAVGFQRATGRKLYYGVYGSAAAICWGYVVYNLVGLAAA